MAPSLESQGRPRVLRGWALRGVVIALALCTAFAAAGCGRKAKSPAATEDDSGPPPREEKTAEKKPAKASTKSTGKTVAKAAEEKPAEKSEKSEKPAKPVTHVSGGGTINLVDRGCVSFEPHWTTIRVGQSLTFHSELKKSVTIHVPPGIFDHDEYVVGPKKTVRTGPAQEPGDHGMWSLPAACQAAPHGVQGAGPGVTVEDR
jgi:hypothetical protein